jgi:hypothetical protein
MYIGDIASYVARDLVEEMKRLAISFKGFPFHVHSRNYRDAHKDRFTIYWTTKAEHFATPDRNDVVSELHCQIVGLHDKHLLLNAYALPRRKYLGQEVPDTYHASNDWYKQNWRQDHFLVEAKASALWTIMEAHADLERSVEEIHST